MIYDEYTGTFGFDGQPGFDPDSKPTIIQAAVNSILPTAGISDAIGAVKIYTKYYRDTVPSDVVVRIAIAPPQGMAASAFASKLISRACGFANYQIDYSAPSGIVGKTMVAGQYNSSSYMAGLLQSVMGYVPEIATPGFQVPGWETPIPSSYFKDAPCP